jgi:hypothetical protein
MLAKVCVLDSSDFARGIQNHNKNITIHTRQVSKEN